MKYLILFTCLTIATYTFGQHQDIIQPIQDLFDGMRTSDADLLNGALTSDAILETITLDETGETVARTTLAADFISAASAPHDAIWNEVIWSYDVREDGPLATVWTDYTFYLGDRLSHCGVNAFQMINQKGDWKIKRISDTRRQKDCQQINEPNEGQVILNEIDEKIWRPFKAAYESADASTMNNLHAENVMRGTTSGVRIGDAYKKQITDRYEERLSSGDDRTIDFYFDTRIPSDHTVIETGFYKISANKDDEVNYYYGYFHVVIQRINDQWKITYDFDTSKINDEKINASWIEDKKLFE